MHREADMDINAFMHGPSIIIILFYEERHFQINNLGRKLGLCFVFNGMILIIRQTREGPISALAL